MLLFDFFPDFASPFRNPPSQIEDSDDEEDEYMSLADNNFEADLLGVNDCLSAPPASPLYELSVLDDQSTLFFEGYSAIRRARSTAARYSAYKLPSRDQRHAFIRNSRRKEMFVVDVFIPPAEPSTVHPTPDHALPSVYADMAVPHVEEHGHLTHIPHDAQSKRDLTIKVPSAVDRLCLQLLDACTMSEQIEKDVAVFDYATQNSFLTTKIPGLVDCLALQLLGSCNMNEQIEEDVDNFLLDGSITSESPSSDDGGIDDDHTSPSYSPSPVPTAAGPDRTSRRKHRRIAAPYHRAEVKPKRKELWVDTDIMAGSEVPAFLLGSPCFISAF